MSEHLDLADWRRRTAALYETLRSEPSPGPEMAAAFRAARDRMFATHPQSPIPATERATFRGLSYWPHDPQLRWTAPLEPDPQATPTDVPVSTGEALAFSRIGWVTLPLGTEPERLAVYWLSGYVGGIFLPFRDATSGADTYGGGRYLWDSGKGADLGSDGEEIVVDFNYAYHPSCAYDPRWSCPLAPGENWLTAPVRAGERLA